jgi:hypothetical protein
MVTTADSNGKKIQNIFFKVYVGAKNTVVCNKHSWGGRPPQKGGSMEGKNHENKAGNAWFTLTIMQLIFVLLKMCEAITWSWPIVLIPIWVYLGLVAVGLIVLGIVTLYKKTKDSR